MKNLRKTLISCILILTVLATSCSNSATGDATDTTTESSQATTAATTVEETTTEAVTEPEKTEPTDPVEDEYEQYEYEINYHKVPEMMTTVLSDRMAEDAIIVIDAFFNRETEVYLGDRLEWELIYLAGALRKMCPPVVALTDFDFRNFDKSTGILKLSYYYDEEETDRLAKEFEDDVAYYMSLIGNEDSETMRALIIYYAYTKDAVYDYDYASYADSYSPIDDHLVSGSYNAIANNKGICNNLADGLVFLYGQAGIEAERVDNMGDECETGAGAHAWVIAKLNDKYYYIDPTWGIRENDELGSLYYFGMTADDRYDYAGGYHDEYSCVWWEPVADYFDVTDERFGVLHNYMMNFVEEFVPNHEQQTIYILADGLEVVFDAE